MESSSAESLNQKRCVPCEGGVPKYSVEQAKQQLEQLHGWRLTNNDQRIRKDWKFKNFISAMDFFKAVTELAEYEMHHPDLHLQEYNHAWIEIWTHAVGGLSENDFILAAKIDRIASRLSKPPESVIAEPSL